MTIAGSAAPGKPRVGDAPPGVGCVSRAGGMCAGRAPRSVVIMTDQQKPQDDGGRSFPPFNAAGLAIGIGLGIAFGVALDNIGAGLAIGIGIGVAFSLAFGAAEADRRKKRDRDDDGDRGASD